jgi:hypothetical protein
MHLSTRPIAPRALDILKTGSVLVGVCVLISHLFASRAHAAQAVPSIEGEIDPSDLAYKAPAARFLATYRATGMAGATVDVKDRHTRAGSTFQFGCIVLVATAFVMTSAFAKNGFPPPTHYLGEPAFRARVKTQLRLAGMKGNKQMTACTDALVNRCSTALLAESERRQATGKQAP